MTAISVIRVDRLNRGHGSHSSDRRTTRLVWVDMTDTPREDNPADSPAPMHRPLVVLNKVNKHFGELHVLKDIDLTIGEGEVVVVIGPSGSGKSTLCRTINRLETFESGTIEIDGVAMPDEGK